MKKISKNISLKATNKITDEMAQDIIRRVAEGESLRKACEANGITHGAWLWMLRKNPDVASQYACARWCGIDCEAEEMAEDEAKCLRGELDPQALRAANDSRKWRMAHQYPKKYGDLTKFEHTGADGGPIQHEVRPFTAMYADMGNGEEAKEER